MGLFGLFGGKKTIELDKAKSDENKNRMREIFDKQVDNGSEYKIVYAYSEDISGANFVSKGKMINAMRLAMDFDSALPDQRPSTTEGREGFYHLISMTGTVEEAELEYILRDFDSEALEERKDKIGRAHV